MTTTREKILQILLQNPNSTVKELAEEVGINGISVRHHLTTLQADGLIRSEEARHGVGRPLLTYRLTELGAEKFPTRYLRLTNRLLDQLEQSLPVDKYSNLFKMIATEMAAEYSQKVTGLSLPERLEYLNNLMEKDGFNFTWHREGNHYQVKEVNCPYFHVGTNHPEICSIDRELISTILDIPVEQIECVLSGNQRCVFRIPAIEYKGK